jgi:hypothetical protein
LKEDGGSNRTFGNKNLTIASRPTWAAPMNSPHPVRSETRNLRRDTGFIAVIAL